MTPASPRVVVVGGRGRVGQRIGRLLLQGGHRPLGVVRSEAGVQELARSGIPGHLLDLETAAVEEVVSLLRGADAVVFSAGAGDPADVARTERVDGVGAAMCAEAAERAGVRRFVMVSGQGVELPRHERQSSASLAPISGYLEVKRAAELDLCRRDLDWTVLRPGWLTDTDGEGRVRLARSLPFGEVSRDDVAAVVVALLGLPASAGRVIEMVRGDDTVEDALGALLAAPSG
ncbi:MULTISPECIES: NAD(P)H-binding protein [unclassified Geodermatophilus]|uniref:NAD(P)H-binding protein n=1 Tax=unclassified Geodermatophilus TaxID=2637632 RepID=UPI003EE98240